MSDKHSEQRKKHTEFVLDRVLPAWETRRANQHLTKTHKKTKELQLEFILGAVATLDMMREGDESTCAPPVVIFNPMRGDYIE